MKIEIRNNCVVLDGYVNAVARDSKELKENGTTFVEQIQPQTFSRALKRANEILCLLDHDYNKILGTTKNGEIQLREDNIGLRATCTITNPEVIEKAKENQLRGWSFGFIPLRQNITKLASGIEHRVVEEMNLLEVSIIDNQMIPAYDGTSIEERSQKVQLRTSEFEDITIENTESDTRANEDANHENDKGSNESPGKQDKKEDSNIDNKVDVRVESYYKGYQERINNLKGGKI